MESDRAPARFSLSRRAFLQAAAAAGAAVALPLTKGGTELTSLIGGLTGSPAGPTPLPKGPYFLKRTFTAPSSTATYDLYGIAAAICAQIVPSDALGPGANEAGAVNYIDLYMSAFDPAPVAAGLVDNSPIYLHGRNSGRWPMGNGAGAPGAAVPDDFENSSSTPPLVHFLGLSPTQAVAWYARIYGDPTKSPKWSSAFMSSGWAKQVNASGGATGSPPQIPGAQNLRLLYQQGLVAFDDWSRQNFMTGFATALPVEQQALVLLATNPVLGAASANGLPGLPAPLPNPVPPPAAAALAPVIVLHTFQGSYCLPEYAGQSDKADNGQATWASIGFDGDTMPLGNSIYDANISENIPSEPENDYSNTGFGFPPSSPSQKNPKGAFTPTGAYVEYRPVSGPDSDIDQTQTGITSVLEELIEALERLGAAVTKLA